jgi:hypothetical protein
LALEIVLIVVFSAHLLAMNVASASPLLSVWADWHSQRRQDETAAALARFLARQALVHLLAGILLGAVALGLVWHRYPHAFGTSLGGVPTSRYWFAGLELLFSLGCLLLYARVWPSSPAGRWAHRLLAVVAATNLLYHFPALFAVINRFGTDPQLQTQAPSFLTVMLHPECLARVLHFIAASFAVTGIAVMAFGLRLGRGGTPASDTDRVMRWGSRVALVPTLMQIPIGLYVLLNLPGTARDQLMGHDLTATVLFIAALAASLALLQNLAGAALGDTGRTQTVRTMVWLAVVVLLMVAVRHQARRAIFEQVEARSNSIAWHSAELPPLSFRLILE